MEDNLARLTVDEGSLVDMKLPNTDIWDALFKIIQSFN